MKITGVKINIPVTAELGELEIAIPELIDAHRTMRDYNMKEREQTIHLAKEAEVARATSDHEKAKAEALRTAKIEANKLQEGIMDCIKDLVVKAVKDAVKQQLGH